MKICYKCKKSKDPIEFHRSKKNKDGLHSWCKECNIKNRLEAHRANRSKDRQIDKDLRIRNQNSIFEYLKDKKCLHCPESDITCLDFDHIDPTTKKYNISDMLNKGHSWKTIKTEIDKCQILCANCHRKKTAKQLNYFKYVKQNVQDETAGDDTSLTPRPL